MPGKRRISASSTLPRMLAARSVCSPKRGKLRSPTYRAPSTALAVGRDPVAFMVET
jgi:hypothetical protein